MDLPTAEDAILIGNRHEMKKKEENFQSLRRRIPDEINKAIYDMKTVALIDSNYKLTNEQLNQLRDDLEPKGYTIKRSQHHYQEFRLKIRWSLDEKNKCSIL